MDVNANTVIKAIKARDAVLFSVVFALWQEYNGVAIPVKDQVYYELAASGSKRLIKIAACYNLCHYIRCAAVEMLSTDHNNRRLLKTVRTCDDYDRALQKAVDLSEGCKI